MFKGSYQLSVISYQLSAISYQLSAISICVRWANPQTFNSD
ncbi:hypothetical protein [Moorena sp. SIO2C4]|nr:hypothetical protein [Moorena sp. SIO2C4]